MKKIRLGVLFGGQSAEHEVSIESTRSLLEGIDQERYEVIPIGINKEGKWTFLSADQFHLLFKGKRFPLFEKGRESSFLKKEKTFFSPSVLRGVIDVVFPMLHGPNGEDGIVQGVLRLADLPFVGSDVLSSALCMDKGMTKRLLEEAELPTARFLIFKDKDQIDLEHCVKTLGMPLFVKPANHGSSIGIRKVVDASELQEAIDHAFEYDRKIVLEEAIVGREIECSVLGNDHPIASLPGEIKTHHLFYSYEAKYVDPSGADLIVPALLSEKEVKEVQQLALRAFDVMECEGLARVDFFFSKEGDFYISELNTLPGFTPISLYPKLWSASGLSYQELIDRLVFLALERHEKRSRLYTLRFKNWALTSLS